MRLPQFSKKLAVIAGAAGIALGASGVAFAFLGAGGSGSGSATVSSPTTFTVSGGTIPGMTPSASPYTATFKVHNPNSFSAHYTATATVTQSNSTCDITKTGGPTPPSGTIPGGGTQTVTVTVTMATNPTFTQDSCSATVHLNV